MAKTRDELQRQLVEFKTQLKVHQGKLERAKREKNNKDIVNYSMSVAGLKNSIKEIGIQLRKM
jgi:predicted  nucleic acid-binding Zn-ribbon protein